MAITKGQFGQHGNVTVIEFGTGDIHMVKARALDDENESMVCFHENIISRAVGEEDNDYEGMVSDELPSINTVLKFNNPQSIAALIHVLIEVQQSMYGKK